MNFKNVFLIIGVILMLFLPGCEVIAGIFKAGFWTAIILVVLIVAGVIYGLKKISGRG